MLPEASKHTACDSPAMSFSKLSSFLLFFSFFSAFGIVTGRSSAITGGCSGHCSRKASRTPGLGLLGVLRMEFWLRIRNRDGVRVRTGRIRILMGVVVVLDMGGG